MSRVNPALAKALRDKLGVTPRYINLLISKKVADLMVSRDLAAIQVAADAGLTVSRYATPDQLRDLRGARAGAVVTVPTPPPSDPRTKPTTKSSKQSRPSGNQVMVVYGRNTQLSGALFQFLRAIGLKPIEWGTAVHYTRKAAPYIGETLDAAFKKARAVIVLLTPDDLAKLQPRFLKPSDKEHERKLTGQARPNVLFEAGMAFGRYPKWTVLVQVGDVRPFSDIGGRQVVHLTNDHASRLDLANKLRSIGCPVDTTGSDWLTVGDFII